MNKEDPYRQKTESTKRRIGRASIVEKTESTTGLPPRSEIHHKKRTKSNSKEQSFPFIRLQAVFFILLPIIIFVIYTYRDSIFPNFTKTGGVEEKGGYETISIDNSGDKKNSDAAEKEKTNAKDKQDLGQSKSKDKTTPSGEETKEETTPAAPNGEGTPEQVIIPETPAPTQTQMGNAPINNPKDLSEEIKLHTVKPGETLYRIAMKYYHSKSGVDIIKKANNLKNDNISVGQTLKIPLNN